MLEELRQGDLEGKDGRGWIMVAVLYRHGTLASNEDAERARSALLADGIDSDSWIAVRMVENQIEVTISQQFSILDELTGASRVAERRTPFTRAVVPMSWSDYESELTNLQLAIERLASMPIDSGISWDAWTAVAVNARYAGLELRDFVRINQGHDPTLAEFAEFLSNILATSFPQVGVE